jgi:hypothetical protein
MSGSNLKPINLPPGYDLVSQLVYVFKQIEEAKKNSGKDSDDKQ